METFFLRIFQMEIHRQCEFALTAANDLSISLASLEQSIHSHVPNSYSASVNSVWYSVQAFLVSTGLISKLLWPSKSTKLRDRGFEIRASLSVPDDSPLKSRDFRNHFEHFDERLEKWILASERHNFADSNIGPVNMIGNFTASDYMRHLDPSMLCLIFRGEVYYLKPVIEAINQLYDRVKTEIQKPAY